MKSMQYQSREILMWVLFCLQYMAQTYGKEADTWFGSDLDPVIFAQFFLMFS